MMTSEAPRASRIPCGLPMVLCMTHLQDGYHRLYLLAPEDLISVVYATLYGERATDGTLKDAKVHHRTGASYEDAVRVSAVLVRAFGTGGATMLVHAHHAANTPNDLSAVLHHLDPQERWRET